mmetsp:Transcript_42150/g.101377  ORF Transcript_42150/g.101377 Transcript_42150/m.101377 type:complete len:606 (-) Transcript_42150:20-1837(-)
MSAYAMSGGLFPPIIDDSGGSGTSRNNDSATSSSSWRILSSSSYPNLGGAPSAVAGTVGAAGDGYWSSVGVQQPQDQAQQQRESVRSNPTAGSNVEPSSGTPQQQPQQGKEKQPIGSTDTYYINIPALKSCSSSSSLNNNNFNNHNTGSTTATTTSTSPAGASAAAQQFAWPTMMIPPLQTMFGNHHQQHVHSSSQSNDAPGREEQQNEAQHHNHHNQSVVEVDIKVTEAKIDPVQLVKYVTTTATTTTRSSSSSSSSSSSLRRRNSGGSLSSTGSSNSGSSVSCSSPSSSPLHAPRTTKGWGLLSSCSNASLNATNHNNTPAAAAAAAENAIEFELSINFRGRKYTARRTMECISKLRDDLIREMRHKRQWLSMTATTTTSSSASSSASVVAHQDYLRDSSYIPEIPPLMSRETDDGSVQWHDYASSSSSLASPSSSSTSSSSTTTTMMNNNNCSSGGFVGRGFTMFHHMVSSYVPIMDRWLRHVLRIVPQDSECLSNFLWEPDTAGNYYTSFPSLIGEETTASTPSLGPAATTPTHCDATTSSPLTASFSTRLSKVVTLDAPVLPLKRSTSLLSHRELTAITELDYCTSDDDDDDDDDDVEEH